MGKRTYISLRIIKMIANTLKIARAIIPAQI